MKCVLFVDDEPLVLEGIRAYLTMYRKAWQLEFATSGKEAWAILERCPIDLICCDMRMPGMSGAELLVKVSVRWPSLPRIVLSGYAENPLIDQIAPIAHRYLNKPCDPRQLIETMESCFRDKEATERTE